MEDEKPKVKPRKTVQARENNELGPAPPVPSHRMFKPFTDSEVNNVISKAPEVVKDELGRTIVKEEEINEEEPQPGFSNIENGTENHEENCPDEPEYQEIEEVKEREKSLTPKVEERPLTVLLPKEDDAPPLPPRQVYPKLEENISEKIQEELPKVNQFALPKIVEPSPLPEKVKYPEIHERTEMKSPSTTQYLRESELLSEGQLLEYYQNEQLEFVDDFIDVFVGHELNPQNALYDLLLMYKEICEKLQRTTDAKEETVKDLTKINNEVWIVEDKVVNETGRCGDDRAASGSASYKQAKFMAAKIVELKMKLDELSAKELDEAFSLEIRARSLALQIQWTVVMINNEFLAELKTGASSLPTLLSAITQVLKEIS